MRRTSIIRYLLIVLVGMPFLSQARSPHEVPNVIFILIDDMGVMDLGCYGSRFHETPEIDKLAREGIRFNNAYASHAVCGPSRQAIMTGQTPSRLGIVVTTGKAHEQSMCFGTTEYPWNEFAAVRQALSDLMKNAQQKEAS